MALHLPTIPSFLAKAPGGRTSSLQDSDDTERQGRGDSFIATHKNLLIAAGAVVATGFLCYLFRRPIGKLIAVLKKPAVLPTATTPPIQTLPAPVSTVPAIRATTNPTIVKGNMGTTCVEVRVAGDLHSDKALQHVSRTGQVKYLVVECPNGDMKLRVGAAQHIYMGRWEEGEKVVGAGFYQLNPVTQVLAIDGGSETLATNMTRIVPKDDFWATYIAQHSGLNRVKEFLTTLFGDEIKEIRI